MTSYAFQAIVDNSRVGGGRGENQNEIGERPSKERTSSNNACDSDSNSSSNAVFASAIFFRACFSFSNSFSRSSTSFVRELDNEGSEGDVRCCCDCDRPKCPIWGDPLKDPGRLADCEAGFGALLLNRNLKKRLS